MENMNQELREDRRKNHYAEGSSTDSRDAVEEKELPETADRIHKPSILERLKQEKAQQNTAEQTVTQKTAKKKHEQEL